MIMPSESQFEKQRSAMKKRLKELSKETDSKVVDTIVKEKEARDDIQLQSKIMVLRKVVDESIEMVNEGTMNFKEAVDELSELIKKI